LKDLPVLIKALINQTMFLGLHYAYDFFPTKFVTLFSGVNESVFQHLKIGYFAYILTHLVEYILRKNKESTKNFIYARIFSTVLLPWIMFLLFFLPEAVFGKVENVIVEIVLANIVLFLTSVLTIVIERHIEQITPSKSYIWASTVLFLVAGFLFIIYTFRLPWFDVFAIPPGWE
jgi:cell shape-determining protein MreD